jgi:YHS domain-containing protein
MQSNPPNSTAPPAKTACGGTLKRTDGYPSAMYGSELIYFCTQACLRIFEQNPCDFMAGKIEHPLEAE